MVGARMNLLHKLMSIIAEEFKVTFEISEEENYTLVAFQEVPVQVKILTFCLDPLFLKSEGRVVSASWGRVFQGGAFPGAVAKLVGAEIEKTDQEALKKERWGQ